MNDDFEGGHTRFFSMNAKDPIFTIQPETGTSLLFRQLHSIEHWHDGEKVTKGIKYLLRTDVMYELVQEIVNV